MNKKIIEETNVYMGIDTMQVQSEGQSLLTNEDVPYINKSVTVNSNNGIYSYRLNPDKVGLNPIYNNSDFEQAFLLMISEMGLKTPRLTRIDFRLDSFDDSTYMQLLKLNRLIIMMMSLDYKLKNRYFSEDFLTLDELTIRAQNTRLELENYNKAVEEPNGDVKSRFELRSKHLENLLICEENTKIVQNEWVKWVVRLTDTITKENFEEVQNTANFYLIKRYAKDKRQGKKFTINEFLYKYGCNIFTRKQLVKFAESIGVKSPEQFASNYKKRKTIEFYSYKDLALYTRKIIAAGNAFFDEQVQKF